MLVPVWPAHCNRCNGPVSYYLLAAGTRIVGAVRVQLSPLTQVTNPAASIASPAGQVSGLCCQPSQLYEATTRPMDAATFNTHV
jgi:hypothetical protein